MLRDKLVELQKEAIRLFMEHQTDESLTDFIADYLVANGVVVREEWFPASEPPKERGRYLCYFKYEPESPDVICENTYYGSGHWMSEKDRVTHWAYLPKLPAGN